MPKLSANLTWIFTEVPFLERFEAAAKCGFEAVEFMSPYDHTPAEVAAAMKNAKVKTVLFNLPTGDWSKGERGMGALPGREKEFDASVDRAIEYALALGCPRMHAMSGLIPAGADAAAMERTYRSNLKLGAERCAKNGLELVIEPINRRDIPGYYLDTTGHAIETIDAVGAPNLKVQLDLYHVQVTEGDLIPHIRNLAGRFTHVQIAGNPHRNEPDDQNEVNYTYVLKALDESGYDGYVGLEYRPRTTTLEGLGWAKPYGIRV